MTSSEGEKDTENFICKNNVLRYLGYRGQPLDEKLTASIDQVIAQCESNLKSKGVYAVFPIFQMQKEEHPRIVLEGTDLVFEGASIQKHLTGATQVAVFACTLGVQSEQELRRLSLTDPTTALIYDACCSVLIEHGAENLQQTIAHDVEPLGYGLLRTRYSPGYGDFPLSVHPALLRAIKASERLGLTTTEDNLLLPSKSITAVIGLYSL